MTDIIEAHHNNIQNKLARGATPNKQKMRGSKNLLQVAQRPKLAPRIERLLSLFAEIERRSRKQS